MKPRKQLRKRTSTASTAPSSISLDDNSAEDVSEVKTLLYDDTDSDPWSDDNLRQVVELWKLTEEEQSNMRELQTELADIQHWKNDPFEVVRYFREYRSVKKASHMFRRMVEWRIEEKIDTFLETYGDPPKLFHYLPTFLCEGLDREGDPIYVERTGASDPYGLVCAYGGIEPLADYTEFIREMTTTRNPHRKPGEYCWQRDYYEPLMGRRMTQFTVIMDMEGLNPRHLRGGLLGLLKRMARISQDMYAGFGKRVIILRAPSIFQWGWNKVVKHFFDEHIRNIIVFSSADDYLDVLDQYVDLKVLPECLAPGHGTGQAMPGYFQKIHLEGGMVPKQEDYVPAIVEDLQMSPSLEEDITVDGANSVASTCSTRHAPKVGVKSSKLLVGVTSSILLKGIWEGDEEEEEEPVSPRTQVTVLSEQY